MRTNQRWMAGLAPAIVAALVLPTQADATKIPVRTVLLAVSPTGVPADGPSAEPVLSSDRAVVAFSTEATNLVPDDANGAVRDVVAINIRTGARTLVSRPASGAPANGASYDPTISSGGGVIAFTSDANNLIDGDTNNATDVFVWRKGGAVSLVSGGVGGAPANGISYDPAISADGRFVVFISEASNLVAGDTNGVADVFVRDLLTGLTTRVSVSATNGQANGRSMAPAISARGNVVSFTSGASNLVPKDTNGLMDVFVRDLQKGTIERATISSSGRQQNKSVSPPFVQRSSLSKDGRYVAFDSDATDLYAADTNKHTDVFLRDRKAATTSLVSASSKDIQGNNDSFWPQLTPNGRFLTFESFASNLAPGDGPGQSTFVRDLRQGGTTAVDVTAKGDPAAATKPPSTLQRAAIASDGSFAVFASGAANLAPGGAPGGNGIFARLLAAATPKLVSAPKTGRAGTVRVTADDPTATRFLCQIDQRRPYYCGSTVKVRPAMGRRLTIRTAGTGMLVSSTAVHITLNNDHRRPVLKISPLAAAGPREVRGRVKDISGVDHVQVSVIYYQGGGCRVLLSRKRFSRSTLKNCISQKSVRATGGRRWHLRLPNAMHGPYVITAQATDAVGNVGKAVVRKGFAR